MRSRIDRDKIVMEKMSRRQMGTFEDVEMRGDESRKEKRQRENRKNESGEKGAGKKNGRVNHEKMDRNERNEKIHEYETRERERREKYEREVAEAERNEREMEFERWEKERSRKEKGSGSRCKPRKPPAGYRDPHEVCKDVLPAKVKEKKRLEMKALMNCIAFSPSQTDLTEASEDASASPRERKEGTVEDVDSCSSSETTSDVTDVTPRSSSSGCSSMSKQSVCADKTQESVKAGKEGSESSKHRETDAGSKKSGGDKNKKPEGERKDDDATEVELEEMKYLQDAFEDLDLDEETSDFASSIISGLSEERRAKCNRKNMTFTNDQLREIERVNLILLKKIMNHRKPRLRPQCQAPVGLRKTSAAINRSRMEEKIERENKILLKKLQSVKGTTGTLSRKTNQSTCY